MTQLDLAFVRARRDDGITRAATSSGPDWQAQADEWRPLTGFEQAYEVSSIGKIRRIGKDKPLSAHKTNAGYLQANVWGRNKGYGVSIHRAVANAFIPNLERS